MKSGDGIAKGEYIILMTDEYHERMPRSNILATYRDAYCLTSKHPLSETRAANPSNPVLTDCISFSIGLLVEETDPDLSTPISSDLFDLVCS